MLFPQFFRWWTPRLGHFIGHSFGTSRNHASTVGTAFCRRPCHGMQFFISTVCRKYRLFLQFSVGGLYWDTFLVLPETSTFAMKITFQLFEIQNVFREIIKKATVSLPLELREMKHQPFPIIRHCGTTPQNPIQTGPSNIPYPCKRHSQRGEIPQGSPLKSKGCV